MPSLFSRAIVRSLPVLASLLVLVGACRKTPDESSVLRDAEPPVSTLPSLLPTDGGLALPDGGRPEIHDFCGDVFAADNARMVQLCTQKDMSVAQGMARAASQLCTDDTNAAVARSRASFDNDAAKQCIQMLQSSPLTKASEVDSIFVHFPCDRVLIGLQPEGQPCRFSVECKDGLACEGYAQGKDGACSKPPKSGEACIVQRFGTVLNEAAAEMHHPACAPGDWCDGNTCLARVHAGKACAGSSACADGLTCVMGKCAKASANGGPCFGTGDCVFGSWCDRTSGANIGRCADKRPNGAECPAADACKGRCDSVPTTDGGVIKVGHCQGVCGSG